MEYYFQTEQMSVGYQGIPLIRNIEISLQKGQILTLIGPNGAGKSTILKSIAKQLKLIEGGVYLNREDLKGLPDRALSKQMAIVFTEKLMTELMTCRDVVATGRYPYTGRFGRLSNQDKKIVEEAMELVQVTNIRTKDFTKISDGQRQRVMLARAICQQPEIIILDEPTSFLDVKYKLEFLSVLQELKHKKGLTVIMSLHELELAERVSDRILCVKGEYTERFGKPEEIFQKGYIRTLFGIETGSFDEESGGMELEAPKGVADTFVIAGGGSGKSVFRRLQRERTPFYTGILFQNDLDYPAAKALAKDVIETAAFEPAEEQVIQKAKETIDGCKRVVCCKETFGSYEKANKELLSYAVRAGKKVEVEQWQR